MRKSKLRATERAILLDIGNEVLALRGDYLRRLHNALLALMLDNPANAIRWTRANLPAKLDDVTRADLALVESYARARVFRRYPHLRISTSEILRQEWAFNDSGALTPG